MLKKYYKYILIILIMALTLASFLLSEKYIKIGDNELNKNVYEKALINYEKALLLNPINHKINIKKAETYEKLSDPKNTIKEYKKAVAKKNNDAGSKAKLIKIMLENGLEKECPKYFLFTSKKEFGNEDFLLEVSKASFILGERGIANNLISNLDSQDALLLKSIFSFVDRKYSEARKDKETLDKINNIYTKTVLNDTENTDFYKISTAEALNEINQPYFARIILQEMIVEGMDYRDLYLYLGNSYLIQNDIDNAYKNLNIAKGKDPVYGLTYHLLAQTNFKDNKQDEGYKNLELAKKYGYKIN